MKNDKKGTKKICIKANHAQASIANSKMRFQKGFVYEVPLDLQLSEEAFDTLEIEGVTVPRKRRVQPSEAEAILAQEDAQDVIKSLVAGNYSYEDLSLLERLEASGKRRKTLLEYLKEVPALKDVGMKLTQQGMYASELLTVKGMFAHESRIVAEHYPTAQDLMSALREGPLKVSSAIEDKLRKHYKISDPIRIVPR